MAVLLVVGGHDAKAANVNSAINVACIQAAVTTRDNSMITAVDTYQASIKSALSARRDALVAAYALTDRTARRTAVNAAWNAFRTGHKTAKTAFSTTRKAVWNKFTTDRKTCKVGFTADENVGRGVDSNL